MIRGVTSTNGSPFKHSIQVTQASGMVSVQAVCTCDEALTLMETRAAQTHHTLQEVAVAVLERSINFN